MPKSPDTTVIIRARDVVDSVTLDKLSRASTDSDRDKLMTEAAGQMLDFATRILNVTTAPGEDGIIRRTCSVVAERLSGDGTELHLTIAAEEGSAAMSAELAADFRRNLQRALNGRRIAFGSIERAKRR